MSLSENELISEMKKRSEDAYGQLIKDYAKPIYYLTYNILKNVCSKEDMEECVSDVLLEVWLKIGEFNSARGSFKTWVFMLTKYKSLKYRRKNAAAVTVNIDETEIKSPESVEKTVIDKEIQHGILKIIETFNRTDKELFIRRYFYGEGIDHLMGSLGLSRSAVDNRLLRGRKAIKEAMAYE